jgi:hypothetical protein
LLLTQRWHFFLNRNFNLNLSFFLRQMFLYFVLQDLGLKHYIHMFLYFVLQDLGFKHYIKDIIVHISGRWHFCHCSKWVEKQIWKGDSYCWEEHLHYAKFSSHQKSGKVQIIPSWIHAKVQWWNQGFWLQ